MFRTQQNAYDDIVAKATDENLTSENWEYILDVCDKVSTDESGAKDAVAAMVKRLAHRNANVQLYTLELANALSENCGATIQRELASKSFTDALLRLAGDRTTHQQVKSKIIEHMEHWTELFSSNADFGIMEQAYMKLKSQNPNIQPPSKPTKRQITDIDRQKEEEELQMALALSIKEKQPVVPVQQETSSQQVAAAPSAQAQTPPSQGIPSGTTAATVSRVRALYDFQPSEPGELQFQKGDIIAVLESAYKDWWKGSLRGQVGIFPLNYVEKLSDPTQEELQREAQMEAEVFAEIKNVEKLLALLSTNSSELNVQENEEITKLYHSTLAIRPKLIELIGKYSKKKDDFTQLNEKFIKARRDYEALLEASMSHPTQPAYGRPAHPSYGYPAPSSHAGYPAQQQEPQRYYSPRPSQGEAQNTAHSAPGFYNSEQNPAHFAPPSQSSEFRRDASSGSLPLPQQQAQPSQPPSDAYPQSGAAQYGSKPVFDPPQELGTSAYDSPQENVPPSIRHSYHPAVQPGQALPDRTQRRYSSQENLNLQPLQSNPPYPVQPSQEPPRQQFSPPAPMHQPPPVPSSGPSQPPYPSSPSGTYQSYKPPVVPQSNSPTSNPAAFYR
ncbi:ESCRT-0 subunit protein hse1 [Ophidiomyces ophidiicola]|nr:ESCRT-0 subunit protein hse1 [Ophidiomyces ophidiicola]KAI1921468.1 ESCRT-0 subunit protein hse1 [Ophidiomyces ophidiicola]KAI1968251.1 ESCRT-0 subunit protein hse1 [Ophidiomyces ophidiicola]KAI2028389.1 ESCRT-0 subunit protein hse1 [Ophidiomyces ophidiicola]KAI2063020.1 ESCRT-0 subunit protein hse1 [Ophidiomyces ophidiicola]